MARRDGSSDYAFDPTLIRGRAVPADETTFGPLVVDPAAALATPSGLPVVVDPEDPHEIQTVHDFAEPSLPAEGEQRRVKTDKIRARRKEAVARSRELEAIAASVAPRIEPAPTKKSLPKRARPPVRRPTVPARRAPSDWAHERTMFEPEENGMPQRFIGTLITPNPAAGGVAVMSDARAWSLTATSMLMSAVAGVFLAAALANLL